MDSGIVHSARKEEKKLGKSAIKKRLEEMGSDWRVRHKPDRIIRKYEFYNFDSAMKFVNKIADLSEARDHHPNIKIFNYKYVEIELHTHKVEGLHNKDFLFAKEADRIYKLRKN